jgi:hypothetical protein
MTIMSPTEDDDELIQNNYQGNHKYIEKTECAFAIRKHHINACKIIDPWDRTRDLWRNNEAIDLKEVDFFVIRRQFARDFDNYDYDTIFF